ncbi:4-alpha-glucanotransferase [Xylanimonas allomyrinae]|uniref:4-alpha-glucanotransferase n=1 Tax=Xylanimonas allomyrinae TaxID=2509459 RepID=A0A4P6EKM2_9MICO|nr:4-alpha-glucanotransferase [Xylanimonas allomyrinae]QAY62193.1 4-alpha-glucanotransferase [Xylanimonas allomyrinae]
MSHETTPDVIPAELIELAHAHGVRTEFYGFDGAVQQVRASTLVAVLEALGVPATSSRQVQLSLALTRDDEWRQVLPPTVVVRQGVDTTVPVHVTDGAGVDVWAEIDGAEAGASSRGRRERRDFTQVEHYVEPRTIDGRRIGRATFAVPADLPLGWHTLHASAEGSEVRTTLVVTPHRLTLPPAVEQAQVWGLLVQLYSVRSRTSWGLGDLADLADVAWLAAHRGGADFVAVNPLAAAEPTPPMTPSPYLPTSRRFLNPIYVRVEDIPETAYLSAADRSLVEWSADPVRDLATDPGPIDRDVVWEAKKAALEVVFTAPRRAARQAAFEAFVEDQGPGLRDFAAWCAISEHLGGREWPRELSKPDAPAVTALREQLAERIEFYTWLQWVADEQKASAQRIARDAGMKIGIMHDLAVGVHPEGADAWANGAYLARGVEVGAPPDMYNQQGQNWSQPPWNPRALERAGYRPYRDMLRTVLRSAGALRADHILGLFRLWWIPGGSKASAGTYVAYDHEAMVGILCLEAQRAGAVVVGEDLGVFEPWVRDYLADRGILGTSVMWFEQENGGPLPPEKYRHLTMASVGTHDMPPTAGYLAGEHVDLRERLGLLTEPVEVVRRRAREEREVFVRALAERGLVGEGASEREIVEAMHRYLRQTPSALLGVQLVDMVGERRAQNQPGTDQEYPNWKVPLGDSNGNPILLEDLFESQRLRSLIAALNATG